MFPWWSYGPTHDKTVIYSSKGKLCSQTSTTGTQEAMSSQCRVHTL